MDSLQIADGNPVCLSEASKRGQDARGIDHEQGGIFQDGDPENSMGNLLNSAQIRICLSGFVVFDDVPYLFVVRAVESNRGHMATYNLQVTKGVEK